MITNAELWEAESDYRYNERIGMMCGDAKPTMAQIEFATMETKREIKQLKEVRVLEVFTDLWCEEYQKSTGLKYLFQGAKDAQAAIRLLKLGMTIPELIGVAQEAWHHPTWFECKQAATLAGFACRFNQIRLELLHPPVSNGALVMVWRDELNRVLQKKRVISGGYSENLAWTKIDREKYQLLKKREEELKKLLGIQV